MSSSLIECDGERHHPLRRQLFAVWTALQQIAPTTKMKCQNTLVVDGQSKSTDRSSALILSHKIIEAPGPLVIVNILQKIESTRREPACIHRSTKLTIASPRRLLSRYKMLEGTERAQAISTSMETLSTGNGTYQKAQTQSLRKYNLTHSYKTVYPKWSRARRFKKKTRRRYNFWHFCGTFWKSACNESGAHILAKISREILQIPRQL